MMRQAAPTFSLLLGVLGFSTIHISSLEASQCRLSHTPQSHRI